MCISGPIVKREDVSSFLTDSDIDRVRKELKLVPDTDPKIIDNFVDIFYNFRENSTDDEILIGTVCFFLAYSYFALFSNNFNFRLGS